MRRKMRNRLIQRYGGIPNCHWCGCQLQNEDRTAANYATIEHLIPRCMGGQNKSSNLTFACGPCNSSRGSLPGNKFKEIIETPQ